MLSETTTPITLIAASFLIPDDAARAIGALQDHGISSRQVSVATRAGRGDGETPDDVILSDAPPAQSRRDDGFLDIQVSSSPTPTDMNAASDDHIGGSSTSGSPSSPIAADGKFSITTTTPADAKRGAIEGSAVGLGIGLLAGAAALFIPGVGPILAAGPLFIALAGAAGTTVAGAAVGGAAGYMRDMGVPADAAHYHANRLTEGSVVITVHLSPRDDATATMDTLRKYGGVELATFIDTAR